MADQDPFAGFGPERDRTIIKPSAGRGPKVLEPAAAAGPASGPAGEADLALDALMGIGINPLVAAASALLSAAPRIRAMAQHPDPQALKEALAHGLRRFDAQARAQGLPNEQVVAAHYILCTLLDEAASRTPWGGSGVWAAQTLLVQFHDEGFGGEKVFLLLSKLASNVPANRSLLELLYIVLAFGFEGRYGNIDNGRAQLESVRERLAGMLQLPAGTIEKALSSHWLPAGAKDGRLAAGSPLWIVAAATAGVLALVFAAFRLTVDASSEVVFSPLTALDVKTATLAPPAPPAPASKPRLAGLLQDEIRAELLKVDDLADRSVITLKGDGFFEPGSADVANRVQPLLGRIGAALREIPGSVVVAGHTDSQPIRSLRFPSNWHLSEARAKAVRETLVAAQLPPSRVRAQGRADTEPVESNAAAAGRAKNRRVEITLFATGDR